MTVLAVVGVAVLLSACSQAPDPDDPVVLVSGSGDGTGMSAVVEGPVSVDEQGCVRVGGSLAVWPEGTSWDHDRDALRLPGGDLVARGGSVTGGGGSTQGSVAMTFLADGRQRERCSWRGSVVLFVPRSEVTVSAP